MKRISKIIALALTLCSCFTVVFANDVTVTGDGQQTCTVSAQVGAAYYISLPASLSLALNKSTGKYEASYTVGVKGTISNSQYVSVVPDDTFNLKKSGSGTNHVARVSQPVTKWRNTAANATEATISSSRFVEENGKVSVELPGTPGDYSGAFVFRYSLKTN